jgi:hypothetical protein
MQCEFAQHLKKGPTVGESNTWITQKTSLRNHWGSLRLKAPNSARRRFRALLTGREVEEAGTTRLFESTYNQVRCRSTGPRREQLGPIHDVLLRPEVDLHPGFHGPDF